jgi:hypothetical protein
MNHTLHDYLITVVSAEKSVTYYLLPEYYTKVNHPWCKRSGYSIALALPNLHFLLIIKRPERFNEVIWEMMLAVLKSFDV